MADLGRAFGALFKVETYIDATLVAAGFLGSQRLLDPLVRQLPTQAQIPELGSALKLGAGILIMGFGGRIGALGTGVFANAAVDLVNQLLTRFRITI